MGAGPANPRRELAERVWRAVVGFLSYSSERNIKHERCLTRAPDDCALFETIADAIGEDED